MAKRKNVWNLALLLALLGVTLWVVLRGQDLHALWGAIRGAKLPFLLLGALCMAGFIGSEALATHLTLRAVGCPVPYRRCYSFSTAGFYFSSITPSATGGQPAQVFYMARLGVPAAYGALDMLLLTVTYQVTTVLYALLAWIAAPQVSYSLGTGLGVLLGFGLTTNLLLTVLILLFLFRPGPARRLCLALLALGARLRLVRDPDKSREGLEAQLEEYRRGAALLRSRPTLFPILLLAAFLQMTLLYLVPWTVYCALGLTGAGAVELLATQALISLAVGALPIPGAVGATEAAFLTAFRSLFGPALTPGAMLLSRGLSFYLPLLLTGGGTALLHWRSRPSAAPAPPKSC